MQADEQLTGTWDLTSWTHEQGEAIRDGAKPHGRIIYGADGKMAVVIGMPSGGAGLSRLRCLLARRTGLSTAASFGYSGSYEVSGSEVVHHVEVSTVAEYVGQRFSRTFSVRGETLHFSYVGPAGRGSMTWRRVK